MAIEVRNLGYVYGAGTTFERHALKNVNLAIGDGEFIGLIGHTGSGKSTLIQHLNGLLRATSGDILYNGERHLPGRIFHEGIAEAMWDWFSSIRSTSFLRWMYFPMSALGRETWDLTEDEVESAGQGGSCSGWSG